MSPLTYYSKKTVEWGGGGEKIEHNFHPDRLGHSSKEDSEIKGKSTVTVRPLLPQVGEGGGTVQPLPICLHCLLLMLYFTEAETRSKLGQVVSLT